MHFFFTGPRIFGIRPGIAFSASELRRFGRAPAAPPIEGAFLYIISGPPGLVKIGVTTDPRARILALQTGSPYPLDFAAIVATPGSGYNIEALVHQLLDPYHVSGEWFRVSPYVAMGTIQRAATSLREPLLHVSPEQADTILSIARTAPAGSAPRGYTSPRWERPLMVTLGSLVGVLVVLWVIGTLTGAGH
jgi:hypothetical protein